MDTTQQKIEAILSNLWTKETPFGQLLQGTEEATQALMSLVLEERADEIDHIQLFYGLRKAQTFINGKPIALDEIYKELTQHKEYVQDSVIDIKCERYIVCGNIVKGNGYGINHNFCSLACKRADDELL